MVPALEEACKRFKPKALYCLATLQNPTTVVMPLARREAIVEIARRHSLTIVEDDIYSALPVDAPSPLSALAPDISWYVLGLGKSFTVGLRFAYVAAPSGSEAQRAFWPGVRSTFWMAAPLTAAVVSRWMESGTATRLFDAVRAEANARHAMAVSTLGGFDFASPAGAIHGWLKLPKGSREAFHAQLKARGVLAGDAAPFVADGGPVPDAARVCFGSPETRDELAAGLVAIAETMPVTPRPNKLRPGQQAPACVAGYRGGRLISRVRLPYRRPVGARRWRHWDTCGAAAWTDRGRCQIVRASAVRPLVLLIKRNLGSAAFALQQSPSPSFSVVHNCLDQARVHVARRRTGGVPARCKVNSAPSRRVTTEHD